MISKEEYEKAKKIVDKYNKEQLNIPLVVLSYDQLKSRCNKAYDEMVRLKKGKMMVWYRAEKKKYIELKEELERRESN